MDFTTESNVCLYLNITSPSAEEQALISLLISNVNGIIRNYCGWEILASDYTKKINGSGSSILDLRAYPINTVTSLVFDLTDYTADVLINEDDGELYFSADSGLTFTAGTRNVDVEFNAGFATVPTDLVHAATSLVVINFNRITAANIGVVKEKFNNIEVEYDSTDIPEMVKRVLDRHRRISIF